MKLFLSVDMEGVAGVVHHRQTVTQGPDYEGARRLMTQEVLAVTEAAVEAGAEEVVVADSHWLMINLDPEAFPPRVRLVSGPVRLHGMVEGAAGCDAAMLIGYHARMGSRDAVLDHTFAGRIVREVRIGGRPVGEITLSAGMLGYWGIPVLLVSGDRAAVSEARELIPAIRTVEVKRGIGRFAADSLVPAKSRMLLSQEVKAALQSPRAWPAPVRFEAPLELEVDFFLSGMAYFVQTIPGTRLVTPTTICYRARDFEELYRAFLGMVAVASYVAST